MCHYGASTTLPAEQGSTVEVQLVSQLQVTLLQTPPTMRKLKVSLCFQALCYHLAPKSALHGAGSSTSMGQFSGH
jgi:hypothetical protein